MKASVGTRVFAVMTAGWLALTTASADEVVVNLNHSGPGSLRQAIADVGPGGTVTFDAALNGLVIGLGGTELVLTRDMSIDASALASGIVIDADRDSRAFSIDNSATVEIKNLTIRRGLEQTGGGILNRGELSLVDTTLTFCGAQRSFGGGGGGIFNAGTLALLNCTLENCGASSAGGGIHSDGILIMEGCTLHRNSAGSAGGREDRLEDRTD